MTNSVSKRGPAQTQPTARYFSRRAVVTAFGAVATLAMLLSAPQSLLAQQAPSAQQLPKSVTLITGDRVVVSGANFESVSIRRAAGRENVRFLMQRVAAGPGESPHLLVVPEDAAALVAAGKVDRRLFDISSLIDFEYDDAHRTSLPFIVTYASNVGQATARARVVAGAVIDRVLPSVNGMAVNAAKTRVHEVWRSVVSGAAPGGGASALGGSEPIAKIWLDGLLRPVLDASVPQIGAPEAWARGYEGDGIMVAVLDTGVDDTHPDLIDNVILSRNFTQDADDDEVGHGTHVASIIAGSGVASDGRYRGVAPGVQLLSGKVCEGFGCPESSIIAGMQWAVIDQGAEVINMSIGGTDAPGLDPMEQAVSTLSAQYGALFVIAAGNSGPDLVSVETPGASAAALTVGAVDHDDVLAGFSSRGMTTGDYRIKPDLTAPGVDIVAARAAGTELGMLVGDDYVAVSGTSMATPHAAGAVALLLDAHPEWTPADAKAALMGSAAFNPEYTALEQGAGRVDIEAALRASFFANTPSLSFGLARWPHDDDAATTRTVTYRNRGSAAELAIELDIRGPDGIRPPEGMFSVTPALATLPQNGNVSVRVTANTSVAAPDGIYSGRLIATDGSRSLSIPLVVDREVESYDVTLRHLSRRGAPTANWFSNIFAYDRFLFPWLDATGTEDITLRLPKGRYAFEAYIFSDDFNEPLSRIVAPNQFIERDELLFMDASATAPMILLPPRPGLESNGAGETWAVPTELGGFGSALYSSGDGDIPFYQAEIDPRAPKLESVLDTMWLDLATTPQETHAAAWTERGRLPAPGTRSVERLTPAIVNATYVASLPTSQPVNEVGIGPFRGGLLGWSLSIRVVELPHVQTEYYYSDDGSARWLNELWMHNEEYTQSIILGWLPYTYEGGQSYTTRWNEPVFSPVLPDQENALPWEFAYREGDLLSVLPPMYGDREQHGGFIVSEGTTLLYRNGELFGEQPFGDGGQFEVPPERATYRVELRHSQPLFELTPSQTLAWTFDSGHTDSEQPERLPLLVVRFAPELDERGRAPSGVPFELPLYIDQYGLASSTLESAPGVEVSHDDGASWALANVEASGAGWVARFDHPAGSGYVSLRTSARDVNGNAVEQTLIRAYALGQQN